jgi:hypothetical protein
MKHATHPRDAKALTKKTRELRMKALTFFVAVHGPAWVRGFQLIRKVRGLLGLLMRQLVAKHHPVGQTQLLAA